MLNYLLFDLDGTLTDSKMGITKCVQYALQFFDIEEPDLDKLEPFIGPPLQNSFMEFYGFDEEKAMAAVEKYRERFKETGIFENEIYPGIPEMLKKLKARGKRLAVSSSKPQVFVERILEHFEIREYFEVVVGSELDGSRSEKSEVVEEALKQLLGEKPIVHEKVAIIGDRKYDIEGGRSHGITTIGVTYGYGSMEELKAAKAEYIVRSVEELSGLLLRGTEDTKKEPIFNKVWFFLFPVLIAYFVWQIGNYLGMYLTLMTAESMPALTDYLIEYDGEGMIAGITGSGMAVMSILAFLITGFVLYRMSRKDISAAREAFQKAEPGRLSPAIYGFAALAAAGMAVGLNLLLELVGITDKSAAFQQLQQQRYAASLPLALLAYGLAGPVAEEFLFRGIVYNRMKKNMGIWSSVFFSSLLFGIYHGNLIAGGYAFVMGALIAFVYEKTGRYFMAVAVHILANVCSYSLTYTGLFGGSVLNWWMCIGFLLIGICGICFIWDYGIGGRKKLSRQAV